MDTILTGSDFEQPAHEIANTAKDTRRDVVCGAWIPRFGVKHRNDRGRLYGYRKNKQRTSSRMASDSNIKIRAVRAGDAKAIIEIFRSSVRFVARRDYTQAQVVAWAPDEIDIAGWEVRYAARRAYPCRG
jgi:hypothetical protein